MHTLRTPPAHWLGTETSPATQAYRERIQAHYAQLCTERTSTQTELDGLAAATTPAQDPTLLDELPYLAGQLTNAPAALIEGLLNALDIQVLYRPQQHQATFLATLTDTTPATTNALLNDPRTGTTQPSPQPGAPPQYRVGTRHYSDQNWQ